MPRFKLTYANVVATIALFIALGGSAYAATQLKKNSVGTKQIKNSAVTAAKIKKGTITGTQINLSKLGTVPSASSAANATTAGTASALTAPEAIHVVGAPGEPGFLDGSSNLPSSSPFNIPPASFYKDHDGTVHLEGAVQTGKEGSMPGLIFVLPPGDRPASGTTPVFIVGTTTNEAVIIFGSNMGNFSGDVVSAENTTALLSGITFRAQS